MVLDLFVGKTARPDFLMEELIAINQQPTQEEQDMSFGIKENVRDKIIKAVTRRVSFIILNVEAVIMES